MTGQKWDGTRQYLNYPATFSGPVDTRESIHPVMIQSALRPVSFKPSNGLPSASWKDLAGETAKRTAARRRLVTWKPLRGFTKWYSRFVSFWRGGLMALALFWDSVEHPTNFIFEGYFKWKYVDMIVQEILYISFPLCCETKWRAI